MFNFRNFSWSLYLFFCKPVFLNLNKLNVWLSEGYSLDWINMTKWIWLKLVNMTEKLTTMNVNFGTWPKIYFNCILIALEYDSHIHLYFGQVQKLMFVSVKFRSSSDIKGLSLSNSNRFSVILIWSSELASIILLYNSILR